MLAVNLDFFSGLFPPRFFAFPIWMENDARKNVRPERKEMGPEI